MTGWARAHTVELVLGVALAAAAVSGFFTAQALGIMSQTPARTVTVDVGGVSGPRGPSGPPGLACPTGFSPGELVLNAPGGQVRTWTCLHD